MKKFLIALLIPLSLFALKFDGFNPSISAINKEYCYIHKPSIHTYIIIDNYHIDKSYIFRKFSQMGFSPHEKVTIYSFDNNTNSIKELYSFCMPGFTEKEKKIVGGGWIHDRIGDARENKELIFGKISNLIKSIKNSNVHKNISGGLNIINFNKQSRIFIFSSDRLKGTNNYNYSYACIFQKYVPSPALKKEDMDYFMKNKGFLDGINFCSLSKISINKELKSYTVPIKFHIKNRILKGKILMLVSGHRLINSWFEVYGVLLAPIKGKAYFVNGRLKMLKARVTGNYFYYGNMARKGDKIILKKIHGKLKGKYYNYNFVLKNDPYKYFEYEIN